MQRQGWVSNLWEEIKPSAKYDFIRYMIFTGVPLAVVWLPQMLRHASFDIVATSAAVVLWFLGALWIVLRPSKPSVSIECDRMTIAAGARSRVSIGSRSRSLEIEVKRVGEGVRRRMAAFEKVEVYAEICLHGGTFEGAPEAEQLDTSCYRLFTPGFGGPKGVMVFDGTFGEEEFSFLCCWLVHANLHANTAEFALRAIPYQRLKT